MVGYSSSPFKKKLTLRLFLANSTLLFYVTANHHSINGNIIQLVNRLKLNKCPIKQTNGKNYHWMVKKLLSLLLFLETCFKTFCDNLTSCLVFNNFETLFMNIFPWNVRPIWLLKNPFLCILFVYICVPVCIICQYILYYT